jgi:hypothetical protein
MKFDNKNPSHRPLVTLSIFPSYILLYLGFKLSIQIPAYILYMQKFIRIV